MSRFKLVIKHRDTVCKHNGDKGIVCMLHKLVNDLIQNLVALNATLWLIIWRHEKPWFSAREASNQWGKLHYNLHILRDTSNNLKASRIPSLFLFNIRYKPFLRKIIVFLALHILNIFVELKKWFESTFEWNIGYPRPAKESTGYKFLSGSILCSQ